MKPERKQSSFSVAKLRRRIVELEREIVEKDEQIKQMDKMDKSPERAIYLLREIMLPQHTVEDDRRVCKAIDEAAVYLKHRR